jgi:hypothetical protein
MEQTKQKRGRKPIPYEQRMVQRVVTFNDQTAFRLLQIGEGNLSLGIRRAAEIAHKEFVLDREARELD